MMGSAGSSETLLNVTTLHGTTSLKTAFMIFLGKTSWV